MNDELFKTCSFCREVWVTQNSFLIDKSLKLNGYKADLEELEYGLFFFTHTKDGCHTTLSIEVRDLLNLYSGKTYSGEKTGSEDCPGYCTNIEELERCDAQCECSFVREIIQVILRKKRS